MLKVFKLPNLALDMLYDEKLTMGAFITSSKEIIEKEKIKRILELKLILSEE